MKKIPKNASLWYLRYQSNRGTDRLICVALQKGTTATEAMEVAKEWAERETAGTACHEYWVTVTPAEFLTSGEWRKQWNKACKAKQEADENYQCLRALSATFDWRNR